MKVTGNFRTLYNARIIASYQGIVQLAIVLQEETEDHILAVTVWAVGQIGKHTPEHAKAIAVANILSKLLEVHSHFFRR